MLPNEAPPPQRKKPSQAWPVSAHPPVQLVRPMKLFGSRFQVLLSTPLTPSPSTLMQVIAGKSLTQFLREEAAQSKGKERNAEEAKRAICASNYLSIAKRLLRADTAKRGMTPATKKLVSALARDINAPPVLQKIYGTIASGKDWPHAHSDWDMLLAGMESSPGDLCFDIAKDLAELDALVDQAQTLMRHGDQTGAEKLLSPTAGDTKTAWSIISPNIWYRPALLIDTLLRGLVKIEAVGLKPRRPTSVVARLMTPGKLPLGHWLQEVVEASNCADMAALSDAFERHCIRHGKRRIRHGLLKDWSSGRVLMPQPAVTQLVRLMPHDLREQQENRFYVARLLTFLVDLVRASTPEEFPAFGEAQSHVAERHARLYALSLPNVEVQPTARASDVVAADR